jgi:hypothetical protein
MVSDGSEGMGGRGKGWGRLGRGWGKVGEMTQTLYAHMNKKKVVKTKGLALSRLFFPGLSQFYFVFLNKLISQLPRH